MGKQLNTPNIEEVTVTIKKRTITSYSWKCECGTESHFQFEHADEAIKAWKNAHLEEDHK